MAETSTPNKRGRLPGWLISTGEGTAQIDPEMAEAIHTIVDMRCDQEASYAEIARALSDVQTSTGSTWTTERIAAYLTPQARRRMGGEDTPVRLLSDETLEKLDEVQTRLAARAPSPKDRKPPSKEPATWLPDIYCGHCGERLIAGSGQGANKRICRKSVEDPNSPHPGGNQDKGCMIIATARIEDSVERIFTELVQHAPDAPDLLPLASIEAAENRAEVLGGVARAITVTIKAGRAQTDKSTWREVQRRFVDVELKPEIAQELGIAPTVSTGLYNAHYGGSRPVTITPDSDD